MSSESTVLQDVLWTEKYRPTSLEDLALEPETRQVLASYIAAGEIPHLLFVGPPGSGKTTVARILLQALDCQKLTLNASSERGIDTVREKIGSFVTSLLGAKWNIVFLDEADAMTSDAQTAMRNLVESYSDRARFILTANYGHRIIAPIQSRCQLLTFGRPPLKERFRILTKVLQTEGVSTDPQTTLSYAEHYPDLRQMLFAAQRALLGSGNKALPPATQSGPADGKQMFEMLGQQNWTAFRRFTASGEFDALHALRELFWAVPDEHPRAGFLRHALAKAVHETGYSPDPVVLFLGVIAECMEGLKK